MAQSAPAQTKKPTKNPQLARAETSRPACRIGQARLLCPPRAALSTLAAECGCELVHSTGPPPVAARGDLDMVGKSRPVRQFVNILAGTADLSGGILRAVLASLPRRSEAGSAGASPRSAAGTGTRLASLAPAS
jgi:hypothetical protein